MFLKVKCKGMIKSYIYDIFIWRKVLRSNKMSKEEKVDITKWMKIVDEEINVKSDRALVITIGSILDTQLESLLKSFLIKDNKRDEKLFNNNSRIINYIEILIYLID